MEDKKILPFDEKLCLADNKKVIPCSIFGRLEIYTYIHVCVCVVVVVNVVTKTNVSPCKPFQWQTAITVTLLITYRMANASACACLPLPASTIHIYVCGCMWEVIKRPYWTYAKVPNSIFVLCSLPNICLPGRVLKFSTH